MNFVIFLLFIGTKSFVGNGTDTGTPTPAPDKGQAPSPLIVWITCVIGIIFIGCVVLVLCVKKQPDDMMFDNPREHLNSINTLNSLQSLNSADISAPLIFTPEGSLN